MDGVLLDTEDLYTAINNTILHKYGKPSIPWHIKAQLQGRSGPQCREIFWAWAQLPISREQYREETSALRRRYFPTTQPLPGVEELLKTLSAETTKPKPNIAVATGTSAKGYMLKTSHLTELFSYFPADQIVVGDDKRIEPGRGKPAPDIYLLALKTINEGIRRRRKEKGSMEIEVKAEECLVFEDGVPGVEAARRAGMRVVWCPHKELLEEYKGREKEVLAGLTGEHTEEGDEADSKVMKDGLGAKGKPGQIDDGWAELLPSLEEFPYQRYGIDVGETVS